MDNKQNERNVDGFYTEKSIPLNKDGISGKVVLSTSPMGNGREDRGVYVSNTIVDKKGVESTSSKRTSSIMLGRNKDGIILPNGIFVSIEEIREALARSLSNVGENQFIICKVTGNAISADELINDIIDIIQNKGTIMLDDQSHNVKYQAATSVSVKGSGKEDYLKKGLFLLGKNGFKLPNGEYVSLSEVETALSNYAIVTFVETPDVSLGIPEHISLGTPKSTSEENEFVNVTSKSKCNISLYPFLLSIVFATLMIIPFEIDIKHPHSESEIVTSYAENIDYTLYGYEKMDLEEFEEYVFQYYLEYFKIGEKSQVPSGTQYFESSDYDFGGKNAHGVIGSKIREEGKYRIDSFSILYNGQIMEVIYTEGVDLETIVNETCSKNGIDINDVVIRIHFDGPVTGWVDYTDLIDAQELSIEDFSKKINLDDKYEGTIEDLNAKSIEIQTENGLVIIPLEYNGVKVVEGMTVRGSDGKDYYIDKLEHKEITNTSTEEHRVGWKIIIDIKPVDKRLILAGAVLGFVAGLAMVKKKKNEDQDTDDDTVKIIAVMEAKKRYEKKSRANRVNIERDNKIPDWNQILKLLRDDVLTIADVNGMYR